MQGDVIALVDESGKVLVEYQYDSWGNMTCIPKNGTPTNQVKYYSMICPITYRGYNYDVSTGLYYLQSRYYNPEWGRFLNCDDTNILLSTQGQNHGANLFAYCRNNPINRVDYSGMADAHLREIVFTTIVAYYGAMTAPMSYTILSMPNIALNHSYNDKYTFVTAHSTWYIHKWYRYEYYDICTFGAPFEEWERLIKDVNKYLEIFKYFKDAISAISDMKSLLEIISTGSIKGAAKMILKDITRSRTLVEKIAIALDISTTVIYWILTTSIEDLTAELNKWRSFGFMIVNWRVDQRLWNFGTQEQSYCLYQFTYLANFLTF